MKINFWISVSFQVVAIFAVGIGLSFVSDQMHGFFGDEYHLTSMKCWTGMVYEPNIPHYHWGYRHILWFCMGWCLFLLQVVRLIMFINNKKVVKS